MKQVRLYSVLAILTIVALVLAACTAVPVAPQAAGGQAGAAAVPAEGKWCEGVKIRFFAGGEAGDAFASIVYKGAQAAEKDLGPRLTMSSPAGRSTRWSRSSVKPSPRSQMASP